MTTPRDSASASATATYKIDPLRDRLLALRRLADWHERQAGEPLHRSVPYRWAKHGIRGVCLPTVRLGGTRYTSEEAIAWWVAALACEGAE